MSESPTNQDNNAVLALLEDRWPQVQFWLVENVIVWRDGPSRDAVQEYAQSLPVTPAFYALWDTARRYSDLAWTLTRGPGLPDHPEIPWSTLQLETHLQEHRKECNKDISRVKSHLDTLDLQDLTLHAGDAQTYAQAEIAVGIGPSLGTLSRTLYDLWLVHGGWTMAGRILHSDK